MSVEWQVCFPNAPNIILEIFLVFLTILKIKTDISVL